MTVQPFVVLGTSQQAELHASLCEDLAAWSADWLPEDATLGLKVMPLGQDFERFRDDEVVKIEGSGEDHWAVYSLDSLQARLLGSLLLGEQDTQPQLSQDGMIYGLVRAALLDLAQRLLRPEPEAVLAVTDRGRLQECLPDEAFTPGREALQLTVELATASFRLWLPALPLLPRMEVSSRVSSVEDDRPVLAREALAEQKLTACVVLGEAELAIETLAHLKLGDVISMDKNLREPLTMLIENSEAKFSGFLGQRGGRLAFRVQENH